MANENIRFRIQVVKQDGEWHFAGGEWLTQAAAVSYAERQCFLYVWKVVPCDIFGEPLPASKIPAAVR